MLVEKRYGIQQQRRKKNDQSEPLLTYAYVSIISFMKLIRIIRFLLQWKTICNRDNHTNINAMQANATLIYILFDVFRLFNHLNAIVNGWIAHRRQPLLCAVLIYRWTFRVAQLRASSTKVREWPIFFAISSSPIFLIHLIGGCQWDGFSHDFNLHTLFFSVPILMANLSVPFFVWKRHLRWTVNSIARTVRSRATCDLPKATRWFHVYCLAHCLGMQLSRAIKWSESCKQQCVKCRKSLICKRGRVMAW